MLHPNVSLGIDARVAIEGTDTQNNFLWSCLEAREHVRAAMAAEAAFLARR